MVDEVNSDAPPMYQWACDLFPIHRSLTGEGVRQTLSYISNLLDSRLTVHEVPSGTRAFDWTVPKEWVCREAYVEDEAGNRIIDIRNSNLHVVQYSAPFAGWVTFDVLNQHLHSLYAQPDAFPYVTSYYKQRWGFCLKHDLRDALLCAANDRVCHYRVKIDSELKDGYLTYGELIIPGEEETEVLLSTNICHPSMGNNELSGPVVVTALAQWLASKPRRHTYRILFLPETIGALVYLSRPCPGYPPDGTRSRNLEAMRCNTIAGYQVVCVGDERQYGYLPSRNGGTLADRAADRAFRELGIRERLGFLGERGGYIRWTFRDRGSDERQWCAPGVDLPVGSIMRSRYGTYPEYHTSKDDLSLISQKGLEGSLTVYKRALEIIEANCVYQATTIGEPQLCKYGLYPERLEDQMKILNVLAYADGNTDLIDLAETIRCDVLETRDIAEKLKEHGLLETL